MSGNRLEYKESMDIVKSFKEFHALPFSEFINKLLAEDKQAELDLWTRCSHIDKKNGADLDLWVEEFFEHHSNKIPENAKPRELLLLGIRDRVHNQYQSAYNLFEKALNKGDAHAHLFLGHLECYGWSDPWGKREPRLDKGREHFAKAVQKGIFAGYALWGYYLDNTLNGFKDVGDWYKWGFKEFPPQNPEPLQYYQKAAEQQDPCGLYYLGLCHYQGELGAEQNNVLARRYFEAAAKRGRVDALRELGWIHLDEDSYRNRQWGNAQPVANPQNRPVDDNCYRIGCWYYRLAAEKGYGLVRDRIQDLTETQKDNPFVIYSAAFVLDRSRDAFNTFRREEPELFAQLKDWYGDTDETLSSVIDYDVTEQEAVISSSYTSLTKFLPATLSTEIVSFFFNHYVQDLESILKREEQAKQLVLAAKPLSNYYRFFIGRVPDWKEQDKHDEAVKKGEAAIQQAEKGAISNQMAIQRINRLGRLMIGA